MRIYLMKVYSSSGDAVNCGKGRSSWQRALLVAKEASLKRVVGEDRRGGAVCDNMSVLKKDGALTCG